MSCHFSPCPNVGNLKLRPNPIWQQSSPQDFLHCINYSGGWWNYYQLQGTCEFLSWSHTCPQPGRRVGPETAGCVLSPVTSITTSAVRGNLWRSAHWVRVKSEHCYCDQVMKRQGVDCFVCVALWQSLSIPPNISFLSRILIISA